MPITPVQPSPNPGSQLDRALIAYLYEVWPVSDAFPRPNFYFINDNRDRKTADIGLIDINSHDATESVPHTRNEEWSTRIEAKWPGADQPGYTEKSWNYARINQFIGSVMAALSQTDRPDGQDDRFLPVLRGITAAGRRLAIFGNVDIASATPEEITNNADMADFNCHYLQYRGAQRMTVGDSGFNYGEVRSFIFRVGNFYDDSVFPRLAYAADLLSWAFTGEDPDSWIIEKSADGIAWQQHGTVAGALRTADISGTGTNYWRLFPRDSDGNQNVSEIGESNTVNAEAA